MNARYLRRGVRVVGVLAGLLVALVVVAVLVAQTSWFRDWLRRYAMREAAQFVDGQLVIGRLEGGLLDGVRLHDVRIDRDGETIVSLDTLALHYSLLDVARHGIVVERVELVTPRVALRRKDGTWNVATLLVDRGPSDPDAPRAVYRVDAIVVRDGTVTVGDDACATGATGCLPEQITQINANARLASTTEALEVQLREAGLVSVGPALTVRALGFDLHATDADVRVSNLEVRTDGSTLTGDVLVSGYATTPAVQASLNASPLEVAEVARFVPQLGGSRLTPTIAIDARGPLDALRLTLDLSSDAGDVHASLVADATGPTYAAKGTASVHGLDAGAALGDPSQATTVTGRAEFDVTGAAIASLTGEVLVEATELAGMGYRADALRAQAQLNAGTAVIDAQLRAYGTSATTAGRVEYAEIEQGAFTYDLAGTVRNLNVKRLPDTLGAPALDTDVSLDYTAAGTNENTTVSATFLSSAIDSAVIEQGTRAQVSLTPGRVGYALNGSIRDVNLQRFGRVLQVAPLDMPALDSDIDARVAVEGHGTDLATAVARVDVHVTDSSLAAARVPDLRVALSVDRGAADVRAEGRIEELRPDVITGRADLAGTVSGTLHINASLPGISGGIDAAAITADGQVRLDASAVAGFTLDEAVVDARIDKGVGEVRQVRVESSAVAVEASGPVSLVQDATSRVAYNIDVKDAGTLASLAGVEDVAGTARVDGVATGWLRQLDTRGRLRVDDLVYGDTASVEHADGEYAVVLPDLDATRAAVTLDAQATRLDASGTLLDTVAIDVRYADRQADVEGDVVRDALRLRAGGHVRLEDDRQVVSVRTLEANGDGLSWALVSDAAPLVTLDGGAIRIDDLRLADGAQRLRVEGRVLLPSEQTPLSFDGLEVDAESLDLAPLGAQLVPERALAGRLDALVALSGTLHDGTGTATVRVHDGGVQGFRFDALEGAADYARGTADVDLTVRQNATSSLTAAGTVPMAAAMGSVPPGVTVSEDVNVAVTSTGIDLAVLEAMTPQLRDVQGRLVVDARVTGALSRPQVDGTVRVEDGAFRIAMLDAAYDDVQADLRLTPQAVHVERLQIADQQGNPLRVTGTLGIADTTLGPVDLTATASEFRVLDNRLGDVRLTTDLTVSGTPAAPVIRGSVSIPGSRVEVDRLLLALAGTPDADMRDDVDMVYVPQVGEPAAPEGDVVAAAPQATPDAADEEPATSPLLDAATIDVQLAIPDDLVLRGDDVRVVDGGTSLGALNVTVGADLRAVQAPGEPLRVTGLVNTVRGYYDFQGRRFTLVRDGGIRFEGAEVTNPTLDLAATREISGVVARIDIEGTAQAPELVLSSTPSLDEADVLALIIFNRPLDDLGTGEQVTLAQRAGALVGGRLTGALATSLRDALDVDQFEIDAFAASGPSVTVGNRIGERIYVRLRQQLGSQEASQVLLEYELLKNLRLQTSMVQGARTDRSPGRRVERSGIDLLYFFYY